MKLEAFAEFSDLSVSTSDNGHWALLRCAESCGEKRGDYETLYYALPAVYFTE